MDAQLHYSDSYIEKLVWVIKEDYYSEGVSGIQ